MSKTRSRKPFGAGSSSKTTPPDGFVLFLEANINSKMLVAALQEKGVRVVRFRELFDENTLDPVWIAQAAAHGWALLTKDSRIRNHQNELAAVASSGAALFLFASGNVTGVEMTASVIRALPRIWGIWDDEPRPFIAKIHRDGSMEIWDKAESLKERFGL